MKSKKGKKKTLPKMRNWLAVHAFQKTGSGNHGDKKKERARSLCRETSGNQKLNRRCDYD